MHVYITHIQQYIPDTETCEGSECSNQHSVPWVAGREMPLKGDCREAWLWTVVSNVYGECHTPMSVHVKSSNTTLESRLRTISLNQPSFK